MNKQCDLFIIGGGINGTAIAADAAGRGLSVVLCEKNDLASATSSASSKLIHGGLRYLENYEFKLVREALQERNILLKTAAHLVSPLEFILPYEKHLRPAWMIKLGLFLYDHLAAHPLLPNSRSLKFQTDILLPQYKKGFSYYDCRVDDARLVITKALSAKSNQAEILTHTLFCQAIPEKNHWKIELKNASSNTIFLETKAIVNASGPWVAEVHKTILPNDVLKINLIKGSHIVVPKLYKENYAYILQTEDKRIVFAIPYEDDFTLIGTTDVPYTNNLNNVTSDTAEKKYLCDIITHYFKHSITEKDIIWSYAGVRCLQKDNSERPSDISRDYKLILHSDCPPLVSVIGGKITTHRRLAEDALALLKPCFPQLKNAWTATSPLPGSDFKEPNFAAFYQTFKHTYAWLPEAMVKRFAHSYGTRAHQILNGASSLADLGIEFGAGLYQKEVEYLIQNEWAHAVEDILWRRTKLGLFLTLDEVSRLSEWFKENYV